MRTSFQLKIFAGGMIAVLLALVVAGGLFAILMTRQVNDRTGESLVIQAHLAAEVLERGAAGADAALDAEADRIAGLTGARTTFIAADGRVIGDSAEPFEALASSENHAGRPEVAAAMTGALGTSRRFSDTVKADMFYVAVPVRHEQVRVVRVALPLATIRAQLSAVLLATSGAVGLGLAAAAALAFVISRQISRRVKSVAEAARRFRGASLARGDDDDLGTVAQALNDSNRELGIRVAELARDRARMEAILAGMIEGVIVVDPEGRLQLVNETARQILRVGSFALGRPYLESIRHPAVTELLRRALDGETPAPVELVPPRNNARIVTARAAPARLDGPQGAVLVLHDITEHRRADQMRRDFVANVSHELRTPLTAILGYVEALVDGDGTLDESRRFLDIIRRHAQRMDRLVKDLLRLARLDANQETLEIAPCDALAVVQGAVADVRDAIEARAQEIDLRVAPDAREIRVDPAKLHDILRNLIANASAYAPEDSTIEIEVRREGDRTVLSVADEGPGIPNEDLGRIFERFYRVDKSRTRDPGGTGLGLAIVKHLVGLHRGSVRVENREDGGAQFTVSLPGDPQPEPPEAATAPLLRAGEP